MWTFKCVVDGSSKPKIRPFSKLDLMGLYVKHPLHKESTPINSTEHEKVYSSFNIYSLVGCLNTRF